MNIHEFRRVFSSPTNPPVLVSWMVSDLDLPMDPCEDTLLGDMGMTCFLFVLLSLSRYDVYIYIYMITIVLY